MKRQPKIKNPQEVLDDLIKLVQERRILWDKEEYKGMKNINATKAAVWDEVEFLMNKIAKVKGRDTYTKERYQDLFKSYKEKMRKEQKQEEIQYLYNFHSEFTRNMLTSADKSSNSESAVMNVGSTRESSTENKVQLNTTNPQVGGISPDEHNTPRTSTTNILCNTLTTPEGSRNSESDVMNVGSTIESSPENKVQLNTINPQAGSISQDEHNTPRTSNTNIPHGSAFWGNPNKDSPIKAEKNMLSGANVPHLSTSADYQNEYSEVHSLQKISSENILLSSNSVLQNLGSATNPAMKSNESSSMANIQPHSNASVAHGTSSKTTRSNVFKPNKKELSKTKLALKDIQSKNLTKNPKLQDEQRSNMKKMSELSIHSTSNTPSTSNTNILGNTLTTPDGSSTSTPNAVRVTSSVTYHGHFPTRPTLNENSGLNMTNPQTDSTVTVIHSFRTNPHASPSHDNPGMIDQNRNPAHYANFEMVTDPQANLQ